MDLHLKVQKVKYFNPFTRQCGNIHHIASVWEGVWNFYDIENYKLQLVSIITIYIYTSQLWKNWFKTYKWKPHTDQNSENITINMLTCPILIFKDIIPLKSMNCNYMSSMGISLYWELICQKEYSVLNMKIVPKCLIL